MTKLLFLAGSARKDSINKNLAKYAAKIAEGKEVDISYIDLEDFNLPIYNADLHENSDIPENAKKLKKIFVESDGLFIASPEHNGSFSALLKNSLDWISVPEFKDETPLLAFKNKVALISSTSPGSLGGLRGLISLRTFLSGIGFIMLSNQVAVPFAGKNFDSEGNLCDKKHISILESAIKQFIFVSSGISS